MPHSTHCVCPLASHAAILECPGRVMPDIVKFLETPHGRARYRRVDGISFKMVGPIGDADEDSISSLGSSRVDGGSSMVGSASMSSLPAYAASQPSSTLPSPGGSPLSQSRSISRSTSGTSMPLLVAHPVGNGHISNLHHPYPRTPNGSNSNSNGNGGVSGEAKRSSSSSSLSSLSPLPLPSVPISANTKANPSLSSSSLSSLSASGIQINSNHYGSHNNIAAISASAASASTPSPKNSYQKNFSNINGSNSGGSSRRRSRSRGHGRQSRPLSQSTQSLSSLSSHEDVEPQIEGQQSALQQPPLSSSIDDDEDW
jgi:hypothetical protein